MILPEEHVYNGAKNWFIQQGYIVLAGQPPRGVDHLPVIEIKNPTGDKGSKHAYKPDLVVFKDGIFYIVECKPKYDNADFEKINEILASPTRIFCFYSELAQYNLLNRINYTAGLDIFLGSIKGILAFSGSQEGPPGNLSKLIVSSWQGNARLIV